MNFIRKTKTLYKIIADVVVKPFKGTYYHQTSKHVAQEILKNGFRVMGGGNQRFTEGVYLLIHGDGHFGDVMLAVSIDGHYLDLSSDEYGKEWKSLKDKYWQDNYTKLTENVRAAYPTAQGIRLPNMLVVWDLKTIKKVEQQSVTASTKNTATWKGKPFWIGVADAVDGKIQAVYTYETAAGSDFHHSHYMDTHLQDKITDGSYVVFWMNGDKIEFDSLHDADLPTEAHGKLREAIQKEVGITH